MYSEDCDVCLFRLWETISLLYLSWEILLPSMSHKHSGLHSGADITEVGLHTLSSVKLLIWSYQPNTPWSIIQYSWHQLCPLPESAGTWHGARSTDTAGAPQDILADMSNRSTVSSYMYTLLALGIIYSKNAWLWSLTFSQEVELPWARGQVKSNGNPSQVEYCQLDSKITGSCFWPPDSAK